VSVTLGTAAIIRRTTGILDKRPRGIRCKGGPSTGRINLRLKTIGQKTREREGVKQTAVRMRTSYHTARHQTTALRALRCAHSRELQHGAVRYNTPATHMPQHGTHGAVRTPRSYNTAQCSSGANRTARTARMVQGAHRGGTARLGTHR
jgi:hypothetical protein